jgi:hypothetical protein
MISTISWKRLAEIFERSICTIFQRSITKIRSQFVTVESQCAMKNSSPAEQYRVKCLLNWSFANHVKRAGGFAKQQEVWVVKERTSNRNALALASPQPSAAFTNRGSKPSGHSRINSHALASSHTRWQLACLASGRMIRRFSRTPVTKRRAPAAPPQSAAAPRWNWSVAIDISDGTDPSSGS